MSDDGARSILVTGASSGVGEALALRLAGPGTTLLLTARRVSELERVATMAQARGAVAHVLPADLRDGDAVDALARDVLAVGAPDVVVANAGHSIARPVLAQPDRYHDYERSFGANALGHIRLLLPLLGPMATRGSGHVVVVTSATTFLPAPGWQTYDASKAALATWARCIAPELRPRGIDVSEVALGLVRTPMSAPTYGPRPRFAASPERAAARVAGVIERPRALTIPAWARLATGVAAVAPGLAGRAAARVSRGVR